MSVCVYTYLDLDKWCVCVPCFVHRTCGASLSLCIFPFSGSHCYSLYTRNRPHTLIWPQPPHTSTYINHPSSSSPIIRVQCAPTIRDMINVAIDLIIIARHSQVNHTRTHDLPIQSAHTGFFGWLFRAFAH